MKLAEINPFIRYAYLQPLRPLPFMTCAYDHRLLYIKSGGLVIHTENSSKRAAENSLIIWRPGIPYRFETQTPTKVIILNFDLTQNYSHISSPLRVVRESEFISENILEQPEPEDCPELFDISVSRSMSYAENDLALIVRELRDKKRFFRETSSAILKKLLCDAARSIISDERTDNTIDRVIAYIRENFSSDITNREIAESVNYHEFYVNRLILEQTGMTLHQYLTSYRLQVAEKLLITTDLSVSKIAESCGFTTPAYFISVFHKRQGETPNEYRRRRNGMI